MQKTRPEILFVDDDVNLLASLRRSLSNRADKWNMCFESDPHRALIDFKKMQPCIVVSDQQMPKLDGLDMILAMQELATWPVEYLLLTGSGDFSIAVEAINSTRVFRFLTKPCSASDLEKSIEDALSVISERSSDQDVGNGLFDSPAAAALDMLSASFLVLDEKARLVYANQSAVALLGEKNGLQLDQGGICRGKDAAETAKLHQAIANCFAGSGEDTRFISMTRACEGRDLPLAIAQTKQPQATTGHVMAVVVDPETMALPSPEALVDLLKLTLAEAKIAHTIASGESLELAADEGGITVSSARTYLKRVYAKTGVNRQADLARLVLSSPLSMMKHTGTG